MRKIVFAKSLMLPYFWINPNVGADQSKLPFLLSFSDHWIKVLFPFKKKISYLCKTKSNCHALSSWFSFLFKVVCFPIKFRTSLQANLLIIFLKKKWVEFIEHSSLNHLNLVKIHLLLHGVSRRRLRSSLGRTPNMFLKMKAWWWGEKVLVK